MKYNYTLTNIVKQFIKEKGLINTGKTFNTIKVFNVVMNNTLFIDINATNYFIYLWNDEISEDFLRYQLVTDEIEKLLLSNVDYDKIINDEQIYFINRIQLRINGKNVITYF